MLNHDFIHREQRIMNMSLEQRNASGCQLSPPHDIDQVIGEHSKVSSWQGRVSTRKNKENMDGCAVIRSHI